ncbi:hypothetical protein cypCar_00040454 [Cyprinus carpio]|nr:hypothetical protein cypCar_00040454 [Cyprinus carpio]
MLREDEPRPLIEGPEHDEGLDPETKKQKIHQPTSVDPLSRASAEDCLKHRWLQPEEACLQSVSEPVAAADEDEEEEEELIVMAAYTLSQCRQSSDKQSLTPEQKAISKRFKFEQPFSALPGEFIY